MSVDVSTNRSRVGTFNPGHGAAGVIIINFIKLIKIIGCVSFVKMLLIMSGIEQNPGPDIFIFRYQYLLVNIGTKVLWELFVVMAGNDISKYLTSKSKDIRQLTVARLITPAQKQMLLSANYQPCIADFDITFLSCLLRNICGLCPPRDQVWMKPAPTDTCTEADIARLRMCRNELMHSDKLRLPDAELKVKWKELSMILTRLNQKAGIAQLQQLIDDAEHMDVDEELRNEYDETMKAWEETDKIMDHRIEELKSEVSEVKHEVTDVKREVSDVKHEVTDIKHKVTVVKHEVADLKHEVSHELIGVKKKLDDVALSQQKTKSQHAELTDIQQDIIEMYKCHFKALPVLPVFENKKEDLLHMYQSPTMSRVESTRNSIRSNVDQTRTGTKPINGYSDIFCEENKSFKQIFITGDAGVGKTSFCKHLCLLWCMAKCGDRLGSECEELQKDVDFISKFEYVFYINLRDTYHTHVLDMIIEQFYESKEKYEQFIRSILRHKQCLVLMDGMDEWSPKKVGKKNHKIPEKIYSEGCVYLTTCRPYRIESVRLSHKTDTDHQIQMTGISGASSERYIKNVINCINKRTSSDKKVSDFKHEIDKCGLEDQLCIPLIASHLVLVWFESRLTDMPRAVIYSNILEMLFERAKQRGVDFPPSLTSQNKVKKSETLSRYFRNKMSNFKSNFTHTRSLQLPDSLSKLIYLNEYVNLLYKVCHLSFCSMFKQEDNVASLIFTRKQLESEPYCFSFEETNFLCKIGVLSKNEVFWSYSVEKLKLSFIHKSYLEYFAALFISTFDPSKLFNDVTERWKRLDEILPFENLLLLLAGFFYDGIQLLFNKIYLQLSDDLTLIRRNAIFHYEDDFYKNQMKSLQNIVVNCFKEFSRSKATVLKMEDFIFDDDSNGCILRHLLFFNRTCVKSIYSDEGKYYPEFDQIHCLQYLYVWKVSSANISKFALCMLQNNSTLHTVSIEGDYKDQPLIPELPVRSLHHLTSLSLSRVKMQHYSLHYLVKFLSDNVHIENIKLSHVFCDNHRDDDSDCTLTLNLSQHTKLTSLCLDRVNILCNNVNNFCLQSIILYPLSERIVRLCYIDIFNCIKDSELEHLGISGYYDYRSLDYDTMKTFTSTAKSLSWIRSLTLWCMKLPEDFLLQLHPHVTQMEIALRYVTMIQQCFHCFVQSCINSKSEMKVQLIVCKITSDDGEANSEMSEKGSVKYMSEHLESISTIKITYKDDNGLDFETTKCQ